MRNVTVTLEEEVARWARVRAAEQGMSLSRMLGALLRERMLEERNYEAAMKSYLSRGPWKFEKSAAYPSREELHDRKSFR